jgi:hypothetical protein
VTPPAIDSASLDGLVPSLAHGRASGPRSSLSD